MSCAPNQTSKTTACTPSDVLARRDECEYLRELPLTHPASASGAR